MDPITIPGIFTAAGTVLTGYMALTVDFFEGMWANPMGQLIIGLTIASGAIGLAYKLFFRRKRV